MKKTIILEIDIEANKERVKEIFGNISNYLCLLADSNEEVKEHRLITIKDIKELEAKIKDLESQNQDLDYLLNSGRNKYEQERNKRLRELEEKLKRVCTNCKELSKEPIILLDEYEK